MSILFEVITQVKNLSESEITIIKAFIAGMQTQKTIDFNSKSKQELVKTGT